MSFSIRRLALPLALVILSPGAQAQTLNLRPGGWDLTMSVAMGGAAARVSQLKSCVTKEELEKDQAFQKDEGCVQKLSERTPTRYAGTMSCKSTAGQSQGTFEIVARTPETVLMTTSVKGKGPQGNFDIRTEIKRAGPTRLNTESSLISGTLRM